MQARAIYLEFPIDRRSVVGPQLTTPVDTKPAVSPRTACSPEIEHAILAILDSAIASGETIDVFHRRKEHALGELFARLGVADSRLLHRRLSNPKDADPLAIRFGRMIEQRRARLLAFLGDASRRAALAGRR